MTIASLLVLIVIVAATPIWLVPYWRGRPSGLATMSMPAFWPFGRSAWRGLQRGLALPPIGCVIALAGYFLADPVQRPANAASGSPAPAWFVLGFLTLLFGVIALQLSVILFNKPAFVVPPSMRNERGVIQEWLIARHDNDGDA